MELVPVQSFGNNDEFYARFISGAVEDNQGRVLITNSALNYEFSIHVFNADGTYHTQLGRNGRGPGEYIVPYALQEIGGTIFVLEARSYLLNEYSTADYSFVRTTPVERWTHGLTNGYIQPRHDGNVLVASSSDRSKLGRQYTEYQVMDSQGNRLYGDPLVFPAGFSVGVGVGDVLRPSMPISFLGQTLTARSDDDRLMVDDEHNIWVSVLADAQREFVEWWILK